MQKIKTLEQIQFLKEFTNLVFIGSLFILGLSRFLFVPRTEPIIAFKERVIEDENFIIFSIASTLTYVSLISIIILNFTNYRNIYSPDSISVNFIFIFSIILIYRLLKYILTISFFLLIGRKQDNITNLSNRFSLIYTRLIITIILTFVVLYSNISIFVGTCILLGTLVIITLIEWLVNIFEIKKSGNGFNYYDFLYLCILEILPVLCLFKLFLLDSFENILDLK